MEKSIFIQIAKAAVEESSAERMVLAKTQAAQFLNNGADFDPTTLPRLGDAGLAIFLNAILEREVPLSKLTLPASAQQKGNIESPSPTTPLGWAQQRTKEPNQILVASFAGAGTGLVLLWISLLILHIQNY